MLVTFDFTKVLRGYALKFTVYLAIALNVYCRFQSLGCDIFSMVQSEVSYSTKRGDVPDLVFYGNSRNMNLRSLQLTLWKETITEKNKGWCGRTVEQINCACTLPAAYQVSSCILGGSLTHTHQHFLALQAMKNHPVGWNQRLTHIIYVRSKLVLSVLYTCRR